MDFFKKHRRKSSVLSSNYNSMFRKIKNNTNTEEACTQTDNTTNGVSITLNLLINDEQQYKSICDILECYH